MDTSEVCHYGIIFLFADQFRLSLSDFSDKDISTTVLFCFRRKNFK
jgi:hypothetical protein